MNENVELANVIGTFIEKYWNNPAKVKFPECVLEVKMVCHVDIEIGSLKEVNSGLWSFKGTAQISFTDPSKVGLTLKVVIVGNADIECYSSVVNPNDKYPSVKHVTITKLNYEKE